MTTNVELFAPVQARRAVEAAVEQIADRVQSGELQAGDALPSERVLATRMQISRKTLREAIRLLVEAKCIEVRPGSGGGMVVVSEFIPTDLRERSAMQFADISYVLESRRLCEPKVAQLAGVFAEPADFTVMERAIEMQQRHSSDRTRVLNLDTRFHLALARASRNPIMLDMMKSLFAKIEIAFDILSMRSPSEVDASIELHIETLAALRSRDPGRIESVMDAHIGYLEDRYEAEGGRLRLRQLPNVLVPKAAASSVES